MAYTGPGDIKTFKVWGGLRAYSAAAAGNNCADIAATNSGGTTTIKTLVSGNFDSASAATALGGNAGFITNFDDQTGNGFTVSQATAANKPQIQLNVLQGGTLPELRFPGVSFSNIFSMQDGGTFTTTNPWAMVAVVKPVSFSGQRPFLQDGSTSTGGEQGLIYDSATQAGFWYQNFTDAGPFTWSIGSYHRVIAVNNGASSFFMLDGVVNSFTGDTTAWQTAGILIGDNTGQISFSMVEFGVISGALNTTDAGTLDTNINNYWFAAAPPAGINIWPYKV